MSRKFKWAAALLAAVLTLSLFGGIAGADDQRDFLFGRIRTVFETVEKYHKDGADLEKFFAGAVKGGLEALGDPHTNYYSPPEFRAFQESLNGRVTGIGVYLDLDGNYVVVSSPIKGSPAAAAGLKTGDRILEVDGTSIVGATLEAAAALIRGEEGTPVTLKVERPSEQRTFTVTITRAVIQIPEVDYRMLEDEIGYVQIYSFGSAASREFFRAVDSLKNQGARALVLDLRQNPGGYVQAAIEVASGFVPANEPVMHEVGRKARTVHRSRGTLINLPVVVLVDGGTASASEIVAGAIQDYGVGPLVGTTTFGKGTVQQLLWMEDMAGMKVTIAEYLTAKERHVHGIGLTPDVVVEPHQPNAELLKPLEFNRVLLVGRVGLDVLAVQQRLHYLGYRPDLDGYFSTKTRQAVLQFAKNNGLREEPIVDGKFLEALNREVVAHAEREEQFDLQLIRALKVLKESME